MLKLEQILSIILMITCLFACEKPNWTFPEDVDFKADPSVAKTTDILQFEIIPSSSSSLNKNLFYRWDWEGDQIWDTDFSSTMVIKKRFLNSGEHLVYLQYADGKGNTKIVSQKVNITQGFSSPKAEFNISPSTGNFTREFYFDASNTVDDEDSLSDLLFRWDFQGDGFWDTEFSSSPKASKKFKEPGFYHPKLEVKDPAKLFGSIIKDLTVNNTDTLIQVNITWPTEQIRVGDTVIFDASTSGYPNDPDREFKTSWYLPNNPVWTEPSYEKQKSVIFRSEGNNQIRCKIIMDFSSLENSATAEIFAAEENLPPVPSFEISIPYGNINTQFYFDCWGSRDDHLPTSQILIRWDWDNDGTWDTPFSLDKIYYHQYTEPGQYTAVLQAKDDLQVTAKTSVQITVSPYENPTGYFIDNRDRQIYGTVQIGSQWWMAENLRFEVPGKSKSGFETSICLWEQQKWCELGGKLYHVSGITEDRFDNKEDQVCPKGWHLPEKSDLELLVSNLGGEQNATELLFGGSSDFNGKYFGYVSFYIETEGMIPKDTVYVFHETYETFYLTSSSIAPDINEARTDIYMIKVSRNDGSFWEGYMPTRYYVPIRCLKDE